MSIIDSTITRLQQLALGLSSVKSAPQTPPESAAVLPLAVAFIGSASAELQTAGVAKYLYNFQVDIHVSLSPLKSAYTQIDQIIPEYLAALAGDPTLNGQITTVVYPVTCEVSPTSWNGINTLMASFTVPCKYMGAST